MPSAMINGIAKGQANPNGTYNADPNDYAHNFQLGGPVNNTGMYGIKSDIAGGPQGNWDTSQSYAGANGTHWQYSPSGNGWIQYGAPQGAQQMQQFGAMDFRAKIPETENTLYNQMAGQVGGQVSQAVKSVQQGNSGRGLLYGGVNAGQEGRVRAAGAQQLASGKSAINEGVENAANQMDQAAINTGIQIQQQQQQMQNLIYQQALAKMNANNAGFSGLMGAVGMGVGMYAGAGTGAGVVGGGLIGQQAGRAL